MWRHSMRYCASLFDMRFMSVVSDYSHGGMKMLSTESIGAGFVQRYQSMYVNVRFVFILFNILSSFGVS